jgi:hypothetical protein
LQSLVLDLTGADKEARALGVHGAAVLEGLRTVHDAEPLAREILGETTQLECGGNQQTAVTVGRLIRGEPLPPASI